MIYSVHMISEYRFVNIYHIDSSTFKFCNGIDNKLMWWEIVRKTKRNKTMISRFIPVVIRHTIKLA